MWMYSCPSLWRVVLAIFLVHIVHRGDCLKRVGNVTLNRRRIANQTYPAETQVHSNNIRRPYSALKPHCHLFCAAVVNTPEQLSKKDNGILSHLSHSYKGIRDYVANKVRKLLENRGKALSSNHPLRHQRWEIQLYRKTGILGLLYRTETLGIDFMEDGTLTTSKGHKGNWWSEYGDVVWKIYFDPGVDVATYFNAQFCWNYLGESAFMRRGIIYQDRPPGRWIPQYLFRPVIGKFTGHGVQ